MSESQILRIHKLAGGGLRLGSTEDFDAPPRITGLSTDKVEEGQAEGWLTLVDGAPVSFPGGPADKPWARTHTFVQAEKIIFHTINGDVTYRVTRNPGKYGADGEHAFVAGDPTTEVFHDYRLELEG